MDRQRKRPTKSSSKRRSAGRRAAPEPVLIAARRPNSPLMVKARASASASPKAKRESLPPPPEPKSERAAAPAPKRAVRIVQPTAPGADEREREREKLLARLLGAEGRSAVTRAAREYLAQGFEFPRDQPTQLKLLEHLDEEVIRCSIAALVELFALEPVTKRPLLEQRLKRVEDTAEDGATRQAAAELRRSLRV